MGILQRFGDIMSANFNALLDKAEDPAKMIDQMLRKAREDLADCKKETAVVMANEAAAKRKLDECQGNVNKYETAAMNALKSGKEDDARKLLESKQRLEATLSGLQANYDRAHADAENIRAIFEKLSGDIESLENRADMIKSKAATAKAQDRVNKMTAGAKVSSSLEAFDRMEAKVDKKLDTAQAEATLNKKESETADLLDKYAGGTTSSVDDEMARLKAKLAGGQE